MTLNTGGGGGCGGGGTAAALAFALAFALALALAPGTTKILGAIARTWARQRQVHLLQPAATLSLDSCAAR